MAVLVSDELLRAVGMTEDDLRRELALHLFGLEKMTLAQAAQLAGMTGLDFQRLLAHRHIPVHYDVEEFRSDLQTLHDVGLL